jgi:hypothetical protein
MRWMRQLDLMRIVNYVRALACASVHSHGTGTYVLDLWLSVLCMRSKAWLVARL